MLFSMAERAGLLIKHDPSGLRTTRRTGLTEPRRAGTGNGSRSLPGSLDAQCLTALQQDGRSWSHNRPSG